MHGTWALQFSFKIKKFSSIDIKRDKSKFWTFCQSNSWDKQESLKFVCILTNFVALRFNREKLIDFVWPCVCVCVSVYIQLYNDRHDVNKSTHVNFTTTAITFINSHARKSNFPLLTLLSSSSIQCDRIHKYITLYNHQYLEQNHPFSLSLSLQQSVYTAMMTYYTARKMIYISQSV